MYDAFTNRPDFRPYNLLQNQIPLTLGVPGYPSSGEAATSSAADLTAVPASERKVVAE